MTAVVTGIIAAGEIAEGLQERGVDARVLDPAPPYSDALAALDARHAITGFIWAADPPASEPTDIADLPVDEWVRLGQQPLRDFFQWCQAVSGLLGPNNQRPARVIALVPSMALAGSPGLTPWTSAAEGQRSLTKALARAWGTRGITVNTIAVPAAVLTGHAGDEPAPLDRPGLQPLSLPALPTLRGEVAGVLAGLLEPAWSAVTGATLAVDGGQWMPS
jgi:NAD(P)-dependent dehydrogenase (short-subunit alcohol dehydrogenase family)